METEHIAVRAKIHTRAKTARKVSIKYSYMNLMSRFSVRTFDLLFIALRFS